MAEEKFIALRDSKYITYNNIGDIIYVYSIQNGEGGAGGFTLFVARKYDFRCYEEVYKLSCTFSKLV